jgi:hypothetical protein
VPHAVPPGAADDVDRAPEPMLRRFVLKRDRSDDDFLPPSNLGFRFAGSG